MKTLMLAFCLTMQIAYAQKISIEGTLLDSAVALPSATVLLLNPTDSSLLNFTASDHTGRFSFNNLNRQSYLLKISYVGFITWYKVLSPTPTESVINVGLVKLQEDSRRLDEILVEGKQIPVVIKKDTVEFNARSFKTRENAMVEDLLKKLPGVEVDNDGTIRAQGKEVQRVTVDGKSFFGNDPKLATRNLPADAVSKVQVFDKKSDQAAFTGIDDGQKEKTINLELKEGKRKGAFGQISAGIGDDWRYEGKASINKFQKGKQLSFLGMANNINEQGFGIDDYMNFTGGSQAMMSGRGSVRIELNDDNQNGVPLNFGGRPNGIMTSYASGINFNKDLNKKTELNTSYFYNHLDHKTAEDLFRENFFPSGTFTFAQQSKQENTNDNHRLNVIVDHKIDSLNSIKVSTALSHNTTAGMEQSSSSLGSGDGALINSARRSVEGSSTTSRVTSSILWRHRFQKKGRTLSANLQFNGSFNDRSATQNAFITNGAEEKQYLQRNGQSINNTTTGATLSYTEPLGKRKYLEGNYTYRVNDNSFDREVFDMLEKSFMKNDSISAAYTSSFEYHRAGLNFRLNRKDYNLTAGTSLQNAQLNGKIATHDANITRSFYSILPVLRFNYNFSDGKDLHFDYETSVEEPGIQQLQPVVDNSDPLNLYVGNPGLRPSYSQNIRINYASFNPISFVNFFAFVEGNFTSNAITVGQSIDENGVRLSKPVNVDNSKLIMADVSFGFPLDKLLSRILISSNFRLMQGSTVINEDLRATMENAIGGRVRYDFRYKDIFDLGFTANLSRQRAEYEIDLVPDQTYYNNTYLFEFNANPLKHYTFNSSLEYLKYRNPMNGFSQSLPILNISISRFILKGNSGELRLSANNLLNKNLGITQNTGPNYVERRTSNALGRYFMITFTYSINKQLNPLAGRARRGMMSIMR